MSELGSKIMVLGPSGSGKSTSMRNLDPKTTAIINNDRKELPLEGWTKDYKMVLNKEQTMLDWTKSNYVETSKPSTVMTAFKEWEKRDDIKTIVQDTITHMVMADYVESAIGKDYSGYQKMGKNFYLLMDLIADSKKDIVIFAHSQIDFNEMGDKVVRMASNGKMIEGFVPPSFFTTVLITHVEFKEKKPGYFFRTGPIGNNDPVKNPCRFVGEEAINALDYLEPNNIRIILDKLSAFRSGEKK